MALDVVFIATGDLPFDQARAHRLLFGFASLGKMVLISPTDEVSRHVTTMIDARHPLVSLFGGEDVESVNQGLLLTSDDVLLVGPGASISAFGVEQLTAALASSERIAAAVPATVEGGDSSFADEVGSELPLTATIAATDVSCLLIKRAAFRAAGALDGSFKTLGEALADWSMRAQRLGFETVRAMRALVNVAPQFSISYPDSKALERRHLGYPWLRRRSETSTASVLSFQALKHRRGNTSVCLDVRYLPEDAVNGTGVYAVELARALTRHTPVKVSLLVATERQRSKLEVLGLPVYLESQTVPDLQVVHRPAQVFKATDLPWLMHTPAPFVVTFQDLIAYRASSVFSHPADFETYRLVSHFTVRAAQAVIAISDHNRKDLTHDLHVPEHAIHVVHHGVNTEWFERRDQVENRLALDRMGVKGSFYFFVGSDYSHKNLRTLLAAYAQVRASWRGPGPVPSLVLVGHPSGTCDGAYQALRAVQMAGVKHLGGVSDEEIRALYQESIALVFPSVYEGFGLPILEAMACGTPVVCGCFSSIPEVGGEAPWYVDEMSDESVSKAMLDVAGEAAERERHIALGRERVRQFTWEATAKKTFAVYERALMAPSAESLHERQVATIIAERLFRP